MATQRKMQKQTRGKVQSIGALAPKITRQALKNHNALEATLQVEWHNIVGEMISTFTLPHKVIFTSSKDKTATLKLYCEPAASLEIQHLQTQIIEKINLYLGYDAIHRITLLQQPVRRHLPTTPPQVIKEPKQVDAATKSQLEDVKNDNLRKALEKLATHVS